MSQKSHRFRKCSLLEFRLLLTLVFVPNYQLKFMLSSSKCNLFKNALEFTYYIHKWKKVLTLKRFCKVSKKKKRDRL
jgi:hypothetical protein